MTSGDEEKQVGVPVVFEWVPLKRSYTLTQFGNDKYSFV
jgi:hypothetical protein